MLLVLATLFTNGVVFPLRSYEALLDGDMGGPGDLYYIGSGAPLAQGERGSMASLDSTLRKGAGPTAWRQPELPEVIAMLNYRLDPVKSNAAAYLQHLTYKNDKVRHVELISLCFPFKAWFLCIFHLFQFSFFLISFHKSGNDL